MELEFRDNDGNFNFSVKGLLADILLKFFMSEKRLTIEERGTGKKRTRGFVNRSNDTIAGKNDLIEFHIRPGYYVDITQ